MCPSSILVTKKGTWKLAGFEFIGNAKFLSPRRISYRRIWKMISFFLLLALLSISGRTLERCHESDAVEPVVCQPWSTRLSKMAQPNLDYMGEWSEPARCPWQKEKSEKLFKFKFRFMNSDFTLGWTFKPSTTSEFYLFKRRYLFTLQNCSEPHPQRSNE